jgi:hypothetical protein
MATTSSITEAAHATANATGGIGYAGGGIASNTTASASGFSAYATATQTGGGGGGGGAGASSMLTNAVSGTTTGGTLDLYQTATGGAGGGYYPIGVRAALRHRASPSAISPRAP